MATPNIKVGSYTGTGAAINVAIGFVPDAVVLWNRTDGTPVALWTSNMTDGTAIDIAAAAATNAAGGISEYAGAAGTTGAGFTAGVDYSTSAKVYDYIAMRGDS